MRILSEMPFGELRTTRWFRRLWQATVYEQLDAISLAPESYPLIPEADVIGEPLRQRTVGLGRGGYRAVFRINEDAVQVLTIRRGAQSDLAPNDLR